MPPPPSVAPPAPSDASLPPDFAPPIAALPLPPLVAPWTLRADDEMGRTHACSVDDDDHDEHASMSAPPEFDANCSQLSQATVGGVDAKCCICLDLLFEPVGTPVCRHRFCKPCFYPAVKAAKYKCPVCREPIALALCTPPVDEALWAELKRDHPEAVLHRRKRLAKEAAAKEAVADTSMVSVGAALSTLRGGEDASLASAERDMLLAEMQSHRRVLEESMPDYFRKLPLELARPSAEIQRCNCAERYVSVPKSTANGREFYGCPLWKRNRERGCSYFQWTM